MAKPIFLVQLPQDISDEGMAEISKSIEKKMPDYHILCARTSVSEVQFTAYYDKDLIEVEFEKFKEMVLNQMEQVSNKPSKN